MKDEETGENKLINKETGEEIKDIQILIDKNTGKEIFVKEENDNKELIHGV